MIVAKNKKVVDEIKGVAKKVYNKILKKKSPELVTPLRSLTNVKYDPKDGYFELMGKKKLRTLTAATVKTFAQTLRMMALSVMGQWYHAGDSDTTPKHQNATKLTSMRIV